MTKKSYWVSDFCLIILIALFAFATYGMSPLLTPDEGRYAEIAREMLSSGHFIIPHLNSIIYFEKPPLVYWITALAIQLFGHSEWAVRFPCLLFYTLNLCYCYYVIRKTVNRRFAWITVIVLASSLLFLLISHTLTIDFGVTFFINSSLLTLWLCIKHYYDNKAIRLRLMIIAYILMGCAVMSKGLIGFLLPVAVLGIWLILKRQWTMIRELKPWLCILIVLITALPWMLLAQYHYHSFFHFYLWTQQFARYFTPIAKRSHGRQYYPLMVLLMCFPWSAYWFDIIRRVKTLWQDMSFFVVWTAVITAFFAFSHSILIPYLLPASLPLAVLIAACIDRQADNCYFDNKVVYGITLLLNIVLIIAFILLINHDHITVTLSLWGILLFAVIALIYLIFAALLKFTSLDFVIGYAFIFMIIINLVILDSDNLQRRSSKDLASYALEVTSQRPLNIYSYVDYFQDLPYYLGQPVKMLKTQIPREQRFGYELQDHQSNMMVSKRQFLHEWNRQQTVFVVMKDSNLSRFKRLIGKREYCLLLKSYRLWLIDNQHCT